MGQTDSRSFSLGWVLVSYFMMTGAMLVVSITMGFLHIEGSWTTYAAFGGGALLGSFFAGRASPHHSVLEATVAGLLMVGSIVLLVLATPLSGLLRVGDAGDAALQQALIAAGVAMAGGFLGSWLGEASSKNSTPAKTSTPWIGISFLINLGTLWTALIVLSVFLLQAVDSNTGARGLPSGVGTMLLVSAAVAAFAGGLFTQVVAPLRIIIGCGGGTFLAFAGVALLWVLGAGQLDQLAIGAGLIGALGAILAIVGASIGWAIVRGRVLAQA